MNICNESNTVRVAIAPLAPSQCAEKEPGCTACTLAVIESCTDCRNNECACW